MSKGLTSLQSALLNIAQTRDINKMSLRQIGALLGNEHPYAVQLAKKSLIRDGRFIYNERTKQVSLPSQNFDRGTLVQVPVLGRVSCGIATELATEGPHSFLPVSPSLINTKHWDDIYALIAAGDSMNNAQIHQSSVDDGDYVIVRKMSTYIPQEGDYVVSRFNDAYNLKRLRIDKENHRVVLMSESTEDYTPIFIAEEDMQYYDIEGVAIDVVKAVKI
ncbi:MAG TPA: S24 family peptidase [Candidatus Saccharimonadales bacterium]